VKRKRLRAGLLSSIAAMAAATTVAATVVAVMGSSPAHANTARILPVGNTSFGTADWDNSGSPDLIYRKDSTGDLIFSPGENNGDRLLGTGFGGYSPVAVADWNTDGFKDLIVRNDADGSLVLYTGHFTTPLSPSDRTTIGTGFGGYTPFGVGDWNRDNDADLVIRNDADGSMVLYTGHGGTNPLSPSDRTTIGTGFQGYTPFGVGDWTFDHFTDLVARNDADGSMVLYRGLGGALSPSDRTVIGTNFQGYSSFGLADWSGEGFKDLIIRHDSDGAMLYYTGHGGTVPLTGDDRRVLGAWTPLPAPTPTPDPTPTPAPTGGIKHLFVRNCAGTPSSSNDHPRTLSFWARDATAGQSFVKQTDLATAWIGSTCNGTGFTFTPSTATHFYEVVAVDDSNCTGSIAPNQGCNKLEPSLFLANPTTGIDAQITIG
jgi:hypothetical protein